MRNFCITIDIDWASEEVVNDVVELLDERNLRATFFCTHAGIMLEKHERALHPNFRRSGDSLKLIQQEMGDGFQRASEEILYKKIVSLTQSFCPEAIGVRGHSLFYDSQLLSIYHDCGLQYESNYLMPLVTGLAPFYKEYDMVEIPIFFNDHFELKTNATRFCFDNFNLNAPGLKVFQFHPNMIYINAATNSHYLESKAFYHDAEKLKKSRYKGRGAREFFIELLDKLALQQDQVLTLAEVNTAWRKMNPVAWPKTESMHAGA